MPRSSERGKRSTSVTPPLRYSRLVAPVDAVIVSFNSRRHLRSSVEPLAADDNINVFVVDNASTDGSIQAIDDLPVTVISLPENRGFAYGCNTGWRAGSAPFVLFLNPDASITPASLHRLASVLQGDERTGAAAPRVLREDGSLDFSQRRFPRLRSTYARVLFLHRLFPRTSWTDEVVRDEASYSRARSPDWVSGACMLVRRSALERLDGLDEEFFLYCEDLDLCRRLRQLGYDVRYEPGAVAVHAGGASVPRASLLPVLAASRVRYARKHGSRFASTLERIGLALEAVVRIVISRGGLARRAGNARALQVLVFGSRMAPNGRWPGAEEAPSRAKLAKRTGDPARNEE